MVYIRWKHPSCLLCPGIITLTLTLTLTHPFFRAFPPPVFVLLHTRTNTLPRVYRTSVKILRREAFQSTLVTAQGRRRKASAHREAMWTTRKAKAEGHSTATNSTTRKPVRYVKPHHIIPFNNTLYTPFIAVNAPMYTRYTCIHL